MRPGDLLAGYLQGWLPNWLAQLEAAAAPGGDELDLLDVLLRADPPVMRNQGTAAAWAATVYGSPKAARDAAKGLVDRTVDGSALAPVLDAVVNPILARLGAEITRFTLDQAARRSRRGRLTFHDLLVLCRRLLQDPSHGPRVRLDLARRFRAVLLDEYQDTDPLQLDIVMAIATPPGAPQPRPGQLFFVGDPKQSLYRFRRADIDLFLRTPAMVGVEELSLTSNFRSAPALIAWINHVFDGLIHHVVTTDGTLASPATSGWRPDRRRSLARCARHPARRRAPPEGHPGRGGAARGRGGGRGGHRHPHPIGGMARSPRPRSDGAGRPRRHRPCRSRLAARWASWKQHSATPGSPTGSTPVHWCTRPTRSGPCSWPCGPSTIPPTAWRWSACCAARLRLQRRGPLPLAQRPGRGMEPPGTTATTAGRRGSGVGRAGRSRGADRGQVLADAEPAAGLARS